MIKKGCEIVIRKLANGYMVMEYQGMHRDGIVDIKDIMVFNHIDYDQNGSQSGLTLFGFLNKHFVHE